MRDSCCKVVEKFNPQRDLFSVHSTYHDSIKREKECEGEEKRERENLGVSMLDNGASPNSFLSTSSILVDF